MKRMVWIFTIALTLAACSHNPYLEASLKPAELQGKDKTWFEKNSGAPRWEDLTIFWRREVDLLPNSGWKDELTALQFQGQ